MVGKWWLAGLAALVLSGCADSVSRNHRTCPQTCERNYESCADSTGAGRSGPSFFGVGAACQRELSSCLRRCELNAIETKPATDNKAKPAPGGSAESRKTP